MGLPDFLIIGAQRSGTTWLYNVLGVHPEIAMAKDRKEVHFFDRYYHRGLEWYKRRFPDNPNMKAGEATPAYLYNPKCPKRISETLPDVKLICILRNPVERALSAYRYLVQEKNYKNTFEVSLKEHPEIVSYGYYGAQLEKYYSYFASRNIMVCIFEEAFADTARLLKNIYRFLSVSDNFKTKESTEKENVAKTPRFPGIYAAGKKFSRKLYDYNLVSVVNFVKRVGARRVFFNDDKGDAGVLEISAHIKHQLKESYKGDIKKLEKILRRNLADVWTFE